MPPGSAQQDSASAEDMAESELVERAKSDRDAFGQLYEIYYSRILNYAYRSIMDVATAEEITSNTFFHALRAIHGYTRKTSFRAWIYRIATNEVKMHWRSDRNRRVREERYHSEPDSPDIYFTLPDVETEEERRERMRTFICLRKMLETLPAKYRDVLVLRYFEELPYHEISRVLGKREGTVKSLVHRGIDRLRQLPNLRDATM